MTELADDTAERGPDAPRRNRRPVPALVFLLVLALAAMGVWWNVLRTEKQEAAAEATAYERKVSRETNVAALEKLKKDGMTVTEFPAAETERMREKLKPVVDKYAHEVGEPLMKEMLAEIDKVRGR